MSSSVRDRVTALCARLGADPLLVQGAGGNASWKEGATLYIKASGTWLADAARQDIFVPVDLQHLREALAVGMYSVAPLALPGAALRPSIETVLHALMPQAVVLHVHAIDVLASLVRSEWQSEIAARMPDDIGVAYVKYHKPGAELAEAVARALTRSDKTPQVLMLQSHGIVVGADDVEEVALLLERVVGALRKAILPAPAPAALPSLVEIASLYKPLPRLALHALAITPGFWNRLQDDWALYPDHVVFLGAQADCYASESALQQAIGDGDNAELVFIRDTGVFIQDSFGIAKQEQLQCYYDVIVRQELATPLRPLAPEEIAALLNWESEKYRMKLAK